MKKDKEHRKNSFTRSPFGRHKRHDLDIPKLRVENSAKETNIYLYDEISWWGISAEEFVKDLNAIKTPIINLHINSPGGAVFDGTAIYNALKQHKSKIVVYIDGLAASIASIVAMSGSEILMGENAFLMIHEPFSIVIGTAEDMRAEADLLDKVSGTISKIYQNKTGQDEQEIKELMAAETWFTAEEALENGLIDKIITDDKEEAGARATMFDLSVFAHVPEALRDAGVSDKFNRRDIEKILINAGCTQKMAKSILATGFKDNQRDVGSPEMDSSGNQRDVEPPKMDSSGNQRDVEPPPAKDDVLELLTRARTIAPPL